MRGNLEHFEKQIKMNMVLFDQRLLLATKQFIVDVDISKYLKMLKRDDDGARVIELSLDLRGSGIKMIQLDDQYKFINFIDIGDDKEAMLLENRETRQLRFFTPALNQGTISFVQLGLHQSMSDLGQSKLIKHTSVCYKQEED